MRIMAIFCLLAFLLAGCGGMGGQGMWVKADNGSTQTVNITVNGGGTALGNPSTPEATPAATAQPSE